jgi:hypothetical protein
MRYLDLLTDRAPWHSHLEEFHEELDLVSMSRNSGSSGRHTGSEPTAIFTWPDLCENLKPNTATTTSPPTPPPLNDYLAWEMVTVTLIVN